MGKWFQKMLTLLPLVPGVVQAVEVLHGEAKSGTEKQQLALQALGLAGAVAQAADPGEQAEITSVTQLVSNTINGVVDVFNKNGWAHIPPTGTQGNGTSK